MAMHGHRAVCLLSPCMCVCARLYHAHSFWPICLVVKDEPNHRFGMPGLTSDTLVADAAPALFLVLRKGKKKKNPTVFDLFL